MARARIWLGRSAVKLRQVKETRPSYKSVEKFFRGLRGLQRLQEQQGASKMASFLQPAGMIMRKCLHVPPSVPEAART